MDRKARIAVLVSGGGTNLQAILDASAKGEIPDGEIAIEVDLENLDVMEQFEKFFRNKTGEGLTDSQRKLIQQLFEENGVVL